MYAKKLLKEEPLISIILPTLNRVHLFEKVISKKIKVFIGQTFSFEDIPKAHEALQSGKTTGSTIIKV